MQLFLLVVLCPLSKSILLLLKTIAMGIDAGFDMVPRLSKGAVDKENWLLFIHVVKDRYQYDDLVEIKSNYIEFNVGEHPRLPFEGHKLLRFSSKISGSHAREAKKYIDAVFRLAKDSFGSRVQYWNEGADEYGVYDWKEVNASMQSYEQVC